MIVSELKRSLSLILLFFKVNSVLAIMFLVPEAWQLLFVWKPKGLAGLATDPVSLWCFSPVWVRKAKESQRATCWISSRNVIPDALPGYRWVFRLLGMELVYQGFDVDRACVLPDPPSNWHTRIVDRYLLPVWNYSRWFRGRNSPCHFRSPNLSFTAEMSVEFPFALC